MNFISEKFLWKNSLLFAGPLTVTLLGKNSLTDSLVFRDFTEIYTRKLKAFNYWSFHCVKSVQIRSNFWSVFSHIRTEHRKIRSISPYSVLMWENTDQILLCIWTLFMQCIVNMILDYLKKTVHNLFTVTTNIQGCFL